ncbi:unnamed protein product [Sphenostylis stenocarpa]|uniref:Pentatricopeptide repeat-containing protein n=1 Tax=Sphenostylis stenocarpa TaxID=92480 RepID=A0AA86T0F4_9FABA|nr:unnamed protein product [Sphenostylis stenocarpa]
MVAANEGLGSATMIDWVKSVVIKVSLCVLLHLGASHASNPLPETTILSAPWAPQLIHIIPVTLRTRISNLTAHYYHHTCLKLMSCPHFSTCSQGWGLFMINSASFSLCSGEYASEYGHLSKQSCVGFLRKGLAFAPSIIEHGELLTVVNEMDLHSLYLLGVGFALPINNAGKPPSEGVECSFDNSRGYVSLPLCDNTSPNLKIMMSMTCLNSIVSPLLLSRICQGKMDTTRALLLGDKLSAITIRVSLKKSCIQCAIVRSKFSPKGGGPMEKKGKKTTGKKDHHLWKRRDSAQSGQKALTLVRTVSKLPNEKEAVYGALDKWTAWETEFPVIAAAKALKILRKRGQWVRVIQVAKWMLSKGQGATMATYDTLLLAFDMDQRVDEAESLWNMIIHTHMRSVSRRLFSRMISIYDHHDMPNKIIEVFADMEELRVKPDEDTVRRVARAFRELGEEEKRKLVIKRYGIKWKYIHFNGERVRVRTEAWEDNESTN